MMNLWYRLNLRLRLSYLIPVPFECTTGMWINGAPHLVSQTWRMYFGRVIPGSCKSREIPFPPRPEYEPSAVAFSAHVH